MKKLKFFRKILDSRGYTLVVVIIVLLIIAVLGSLIISAAVSEYKISKSQETGTGAFYIAQSGIDHALWKVQNDATYKANLENGTFDAANGDFTYDPALASNCSYEVQIRSLGEGEAQVTSTGYFEINNHRAKRVVKTKIFKALNANPIGDNAIFSDQNIDFLMSVATINPGSIFANNDIHVGIIPILGSVVNIQNKASAVDEIKVVWPSAINAAIKEAQNYPPAPSPIELPMVDFDDYLSKATAVYTKDEFETLLKNNQNLTLNDEITYVTMGPNDYINLRGDQSLTINGLLVLDGGFKVGQNLCWNRGGGNITCGLNDLTINHNDDIASGVISKNIIDFGIWTGSVNVIGLLYGYGGYQMVSLPQAFNIRGGIITRDFFTTSIWQGLNIQFDDSIVRQGLGVPRFSQAIQIEHWEEEY